MGCWDRNWEGGCSRTWTTNLGDGKRKGYVLQVIKKDTFVAILFHTLKTRTKLLPNLIGSNVTHAYVLAFLMGLNDSYHQVRSQILLKETLPQISKVFFSD